MVDFLRGWERLFAVLARIDGPGEPGVQALRCSDEAKGHAR